MLSFLVRNKPDTAGDLVNGSFYQGDTSSFFHFSGLFFVVIGSYRLGSQDFADSSDFGGRERRKKKERK